MQYLLSLFRTDRNAQRLIVHPNVPKMIMATFTQELQSVCIEFDHNIAGPSECSRIFIARTLTLFGEGKIRLDEV